MNSLYELEPSDDESANQQLLAEYHASPSASTANNAAVKSAGLLNAARASKPIPPPILQSSSPSESSRTLAFSSPRNMGAGKVKAGKLKRPSFMAANLAKMAHEKNRRRRDPYELPVSPQKADPIPMLEEAPEVAQSAASEQNPKKKRGRGAKTTQTAPPPPVFPSSPPLLNHITEIEDEQDDPISSSPGPTPLDTAEPGSPNLEQLLHSSKRSSSPHVVDEATAAAGEEQEFPRSRSRSLRKHKRPSEDAETELKSSRKAPRTDRPVVPAVAVTAADVNPVDEAQTSPRPKRRSHPQVVIQAKTRSKGTKAGKLPTQERGKTTPQVTQHKTRAATSAAKDVFEFQGSDQIQSETGDAAPAMAGHQQEPEPAVNNPKRSTRHQKTTSDNPTTGGNPVPAAKVTESPRTRAARTTRAAKAAKKDRHKRGAAGAKEKETVDEAAEPETDGKRSVERAKGKKGRKAVTLPNGSVVTTTSVPLRTSRRTQNTSPSLMINGTEADASGTAEAADVEVESGPQTGANGATDEAEDRDASAVHGRADEEGAEEEGEDNMEDNEDDMVPPESTGIPDLDRIFRFAKFGSREGRPKTKGASRIRKACEDAAELVFVFSSTLQEVTETVDAIRSCLKTVSDYNDTEDRIAFKGDAYGYLFARLAKLLQACYYWAKENHGDPAASTDALRILLPLMRAILTFKDVIASWRVEIGQRYKGDTVIKDVDENLIVPLRSLEKFLGSELKQLARQETINRIRQEKEAQRRVQEEEDDRRAEQERLAAERRDKWQLLHIRRLECEPSLRQKVRDHFRYQKIEDLEEVDANGVPFEREPVFRNREIPFAHRAPPGPWSDEQLKALIEGLQRYRGPRVFERIFQAYCKPGGMLRDFNVSEITAQAAHFRANTIDACQSSKWPVDEWVKQIPVLP